MNSVALSSAQQTVCRSGGIERPASPAPAQRATAPSKAIAVSQIDRSVVTRLALRRATRSARWRAWRWTNELFIKLSACNGVVVTPRRGVLTDGSGQSNASSMGSLPELTFIR